MTPASENDDTLRGIGISPRERLEHIEDALTKIDSKLDTRFDAVEGRLSTVETAQAGQASTAEFLAKARELAEETSQKAAGLADLETKKAAALADTATRKAVDLADQQKALQQEVTNFKMRLETFHAVHVAFDERQNAFDKKVAWFGGLGAAAVFAAGLVGYFITPEGGVVSIFVILIIVIIIVLIVR